MYGLRLSKLPIADRVRVPPLGASGLAYSRCSKSGPYFRSPYIEAPCLGATSSAWTERPGAIRANTAANQGQEKRRRVIMGRLSRQRMQTSGGNIEGSRHRS